MPAAIACLIAPIFLFIAVFPHYCEAEIDDSDYLTWLVKSVCFDTSSGSVVANDPYYGCPDGAIERKYANGDPIGFNNIDQMGTQMCDSFSLLDANRNTLYMHTFDYEPFNEFNLHSGSDGYDVYRVTDTEVSVSNTKDGGGYGSTFFSKDCVVGGGWATFPTQGFLTPGQGFWPISGVYWEHTHTDVPGSCPSGYSTNTLTSWDLIPGMDYGGINGNPVKTMDTIVSFHGFETEDGQSPTENFLQQGHLEVFYYTKFYGLTRWEVWVPTDSSSSGSGGWTQCNGPSTGLYKGMNFSKTDCHDWSAVVAGPGRSHGQGQGPDKVPAWPLVNANHLKYFHFDPQTDLSDVMAISGEGIVAPLAEGKWSRFGAASGASSDAVTSVNWSLEVSQGGSDAWPSSSDGGVSYLSMNCGAAAGGECGSAGSQAVYQDVEFDAVCGVVNGRFDMDMHNVSGAGAIAGDACTVLYGANVRTSSGVGAFGLRLQLVEVVSGTVSVLWSDDVLEDSNVAMDNGDGRGAEAESVYLSSKFVHKVASIPLDEDTSNKYIRFEMLPISGHTFNVLDTYVNCFPAEV